MAVKNPNYEDLLIEVSKYLDEKDLELVEKAYNCASKAHKGQLRNDGGEYIDHPIQVTYILAKMHMDVETICAGLLHDVVEDTKYNYEDLTKSFGEEVTKLVEGVTKSEKVHYRTMEDYNAENLKKMLFATSKDVRVLIIKLADRLHNMKTLSTLKPEKQRRISSETMSIYAPLAHKLGMWAVKGELEDLCLRYSNPEIYMMLKEKISEKREEREKYTKNIISEIKKELAEHKIKAKINGRAKYFYSIYQKMEKKGKKLEEIHDLIALRIITGTVEEVYGVLDIIKKLYSPIENRFKDYITKPKKNHYQSLHIDVNTKENKVLEVQIRTEDMNDIAEEGIAAHWKYKEVDRDKKFDKKLSWLKQVLDWKKEFQGREFVDSLKIDLFKDEIIVFTPRGDTIILPEGSSPIDFAYEIHTNIGNTCSKAEVNGKVVTLDYQLSSGDVIKIMTSKNATPGRNWLNFVKTGKAKSKIRSKLEIRLEKDPKYYRNLENFENNLLEHVEFKQRKNLKLSKCCNPQYGDEIVAFKTKGGSVTIHKTNCLNIHVFDQTKAMIVSWKKEENEFKNIEISVKDRIGMIDDILDKVLEFKIQVMNINIKTTKQHLLISLKVKSNDEFHIDKSMEELRKIQGVFSVSSSVLSDIPIEKVIKN